MNELVNQLISKVGVDKNTAEKVANFLKENASQIPNWIGQGGIGSIFGDKNNPK